VLRIPSCSSCSGIMCLRLRTGAASVAHMMIRQLNLFNCLVNVGNIEVVPRLQHILFTSWTARSASSSMLMSTLCTSMFNVSVQVEAERSLVQQLSQIVQRGKAM
jgi:hypothetical protein